MRSLDQSAKLSIMIQNNENAELTIKDRRGDITIVTGESLVGENMAVGESRYSYFHD